jgi:putative transposase
LFEDAGAVSTVGFEEAQIKGYIQNQQQLDGQGSEEEGRF